MVNETTVAVKASDDRAVREQRINVLWRALYVDPSGPDTTGEIEALGWDMPHIPGAVAAFRKRRDELKGSTAAPTVPGAVGGEATVLGATSSPGPSPGAAQAGSSTPASAPKVEVPSEVLSAAEVAPPPNAVVSFAEAVAGRRRALAGKAATAKELQALIDVGGPVGSAAKKISPAPQPGVGPGVEVKPGEVADEAPKAPKAPKEFRIKEGEPEFNSLPVEEKAKPGERSQDDWIGELVGLYQVKPIEFGVRLKEATAKLGLRQADIEKEVKSRWKAAQPEKDDDDAGQSTKLLAIGMGEGVRLWHTPEGVGYASVWFEGHWENHQIGGRAFKERLRLKYGDKHKVKVDGQMLPVPVRGGTMQDVIATLESEAGRGPEHKVSIRVGGDRRVVWIDLGGPDWRAVKVTAEGWSVEPQARWMFVRRKTMLPLPEPVRGGDVRQLARVLNVQAKPKDQFVLVAGWLLQCLNPVGPYPLIHPNGEAEMGKTTTTRLICRVVDPMVVGIKRKNAKVEDLFITAKNGWVVRFDNFSGISRELSDALAQLATGIGLSKRANYTDDEEHEFGAMRPVAFNGIPGDMVEASDLASRLIAVNVPRLERRRTEQDIEAEFLRIWPGVFGALLDGVVGALAGADAVNVESIGMEPARLMDFERWAEAGCRAMGFGRWEFVRAYEENRTNAMTATAAASSVGRAVMEFMGNRDEWRGTMADLLRLLGAHKEDPTPKDWPYDATRLSTALRKVRKALELADVVVWTDVDLRAEGGSQHSVVIEWAAPPEPGDAVFGAEIYE
jgi:hypothetical protein